MHEAKSLRSYGRIKGRTLKPRQAALLETLLPLITIPGGPITLDELFKHSPPPCGAGAGGGGRPEQPPTLNTAYPTPPTPSPQGRGGDILEIGFGGGEHLVAQAAANPEARFIGVEPFLNGVASCLRHIEEAGAEKIRLHHGDARDVIARLPNASLDLVYILFPDPWPKARHHKRRLIQPAFIEELARVLKPGGEIRFATDWKAYAAWTLELFLKNADFTWTAECAADWREPWPGHTPTRYEQKRLGDTAPIYLRFLGNETR